MTRPWLIVLCPYFGRWPAWMNFFVESCKWNPGIHWRFYTDCGEPENRAPNVDYVHVGFDRYKAFARERLKIAFDPADPYKLCDLKPCYGFLHQAATKDFPFFAFGDIDVIYGRTERFFTPGTLERFDLFSTHETMLSGHFAIFRNVPFYREAFMRLSGYRETLEAAEYHGADERIFSDLLVNMRNPRHFFAEAYSTVLSAKGWHDGSSDWPQRWLWREGRLTNERDGDPREFLYLHFMRWQLKRWAGDSPHPDEGAWIGRDIVHEDWRRAGKIGFAVDPAGFSPHP